MEEAYKKYEKCIEEIQAGISEQLVYFEQMSIGAEHQGSTFEAKQYTEFLQNRIQGIHKQLDGISELLWHHLLWISDFLALLFLFNILIFSNWIKY